MRLLPLLLLVGITTTVASTTLSSCSPLSRSSRAIVVDSDGGPSARYMNGRRDVPSKKWKSNTYKAKKTKTKRSKRRN